MKLTKAQREVLKEVARGAIIRMYWYELGTWVNVETNRRVTRQVEKLEDTGMVARYGTPGITRYKSLRITDAGKQALAAAEGEGKQ